MNILDNCRVALYRSRRADRIHRSVSEDGGLSWSAPEPTALLNNNSSIQARILGDGRIAVIYNENYARGARRKVLFPRGFRIKKVFSSSAV